ncbi:MAG: motility protein A [Lachnospiraceae bacterium]|nr:motility protein A [Lachnospiraceae bacterium]
MDFTSIIGLVLGAALIVQGIGTKDLMNFWDPPSILIVVGGTAASVIASYPFRMLKKLPTHFKILMGGKKFSPEKAIDILVDLAQLARKNGLLALEEKSNELKDPFFKQSVVLIVDAMDTEKVRELLETQLDNMASRHEEDAGIYEKAAGVAPAYGMIGTLVGLINMLKGLNLDAGGSSDIGKNMSVAMVTTFYGCVLANLIFAPIAKKLRIRNDEELLYKQLIIEGVLSIQSGDNPKFLKEKLVSYLEQKQQTRILSGKSAKSKGSKGKVAE